MADRIITQASFEALASAPEVVTPRALRLRGGLPINPTVVLPDWVNEIELTTTWRTDISKAQLSSHEDRRALLTRPTRELRATITARSNTETHVLAQALMAHAASKAPAAIYCDQTTIDSVSVVGGKTRLHCDARYRRLHLGQRVAVLKSRYAVTQADNTCQMGVIEEVGNEYVQLTTALATTPTAGDLLFPCMDAEVLTSVSGTLIVDTVLRAQVSWSELAGACSIPASHPPLAYDNLAPFVQMAADGTPIFDIPPNWTDGVKTTIRRESEQSPIGKGTLVEVSSSPFFEFDLELLAATREAAWEQLRFFDAVRGRNGQFYFLHPSDPWTLTFLNTTSARITAVGSHEEVLEHFNYVALTRADGTITVREVDVNVQDIGTQFRLIWATPLPDANFVSIRPIHLCRLGSDSYAQRWVTDGVCSSSLQIVEIRTHSDVAEPANLHASASSKPSAIQAAGPHLWFESSTNLFAADPDHANAQLAVHPFPHLYDLVGRVYDTREPATAVLPASYLNERPFLQAWTSFPGSMRFAESWQNNNEPTLTNPTFDISLLTPAVDPNTPQHDRHIWDSTLGWTMFLAFTPFTTLPAGTDLVLFEVVGAGTSAFTIIGARAGGGIDGATAIKIRNAGGSEQTINTSPLINETPPQLLMVRWELATSRLHIYRNGLSMTGPAFTTVSSIQDPTSYTRGRLGAMFNHGVAPTQALARDWGVRGGLNSFISFRRPLSVVEVNAIAREIIRSYNGAWTDISNF